MLSDNENRIDNVDGLDERWHRRNKCYLKHKEWLENMISRKGKGKRNREIFYRFITQYGTGGPFTNEDAEYIVIGKFGKNEWSSKKVIDSFTKDEKLIVLQICNEYGAFDY